MAATMWLRAWKRVAASIEVVACEEARGCRMKVVAGEEARGCSDECGQHEECKQRECNLRKGEWQEECGLTRCDL